MKDKDICVSQIQHFSVNDGEGIRTTVFLSGCPLRCRWCCNPETWGPEPVTGRLPSGETEVMGRFLSPEDVMKELRRHMVFFRASGGGVTWSGGEAFFFPANLRRLVKAAGELGIRQAVETSCSFPWDEAEDIVRSLDFIFADIKHMDNDIHRKYTGAGNGGILSNLARIGRTGVETVVRIPLVSGVNDDDANIRATAAFVRENMAWRRIELLPWHSLGRIKYEMLGMRESWRDFGAPSRERIEELEQLIGEEGVEIVSYR